MKLFDLKTDSRIVLSPDAAECICLAAKDLQENLRQLSEAEHAFAITRQATDEGIIIENENNASEEAYQIEIFDRRVVIRGSNDLGTVFGIYAFSTHFLGVFPAYRLTGIFPEKKKELAIEAQRLNSSKFPVRFRGFFLNDEDLLTELEISGGKRKIDYPFYHDVMDTRVLDRVLETALRMEINLVIPASFVDILNPAEEKLVQAVCRRGMFLSQHHVEPMGVSFFAAENYMKVNAPGEAVSFLSNRKRMEEIWSVYAQKWSKYEKHVIWQLGLRGKGDEAVWHDDSSIPDSMKTRGEIITDAIETQHRIIAQTLGHKNFFCTATLWNEGSELYGKGYLRLPDDTIPVFADMGQDQMFGEDFYRFAKQSGKPYGVYYHVAYWTLGPHLTEGCSPDKMAFNFEKIQGEHLRYAILNVSNLRPVHISALLFSLLLRGKNPNEIWEEVSKLDAFLFGDLGESVTALRKDYYASFADFGKEALETSAKINCFYLKDFDCLPFVRNAATDGQLAYFGRYLLRRRKATKLPQPSKELALLLEESARRFLAVHQKAEDLCEKLTPALKTYFRAFFLYQTEHMYALTAWCTLCIGMMETSLPKEERLVFGEGAVVCLDSILESRRVLEEGEWKHYHRGEKKINILALREQTLQVLNELEGE